jgi:hypothetical protein
MSELTVTELMSMAGGNANSGYEGGCAAAVTDGATSGTLG